ncbi:MAG: hypothetical protein ACKO1M_01190 [Planctomycetota bacterium]
MLRFSGFTACLLLAAAACADELNPAGMPNPPARPTKVECAVLIIDVVNIDDLNESFQAEIAVLASWRDPRLAFDPQAEGTDLKLYQGSFQFDEVFKGWWPQLVILNEVGREEPKAVSLAVRPDGTVQYREQRNAVLETPMELHDFPFDTQRLKAAMIPFGNTADEVVLAVDERFARSTDDYVRRERDVNVAGWDLQRLEMAADETSVLAGDGQTRFSRLVTTIQLQRRSWQYVCEILFPLLVLVSVVWSIFWVEIDSLADRLNISFIGVLTIVAYQFVLVENMPRMSYLTFLDSILISSFVMMALTVPQSLLIHSLVRKGKQRLARTIDRTSRWLFPVAYFLVLAAVARWYGII